MLSCPYAVVHIVFYALHIINDMFESYDHNLIELIHAGTQLLNTTLGVKEYVQNEFLKLEEEIILPNKKLFPSPITLDDFFWAFGILRSRAFSRLRNENLVVIPLADLVSSYIFPLCVFPVLSIVFYLLLLL